MADAIVVPSAFLQRIFSGLGFSVQIIPNLVDFSRFRFRKRERIRPRLLVTRNLEPVYNVRMALEAYEIIKRDYGDARLDIVGSGTQEKELKAWVKDHGLGDIVFHGAVSNEKMPWHLDQADILLNPSLVDNMPISLLEGFASGLPVVSTRAGGIPDLVKNDAVLPPGKQAALLVDVNNPAQMAEKVEELLRSPERAEELTTMAKGLCNQFCWESIRDLWLAVYAVESTPGTSVLSDVKFAGSMLLCDRADAIRSKR
jgi:glycosyltransferase involved in cell wall biosynthesis